MSWSVSDYFFMQLILNVKIIRLYRPAHNTGLKRQKCNVKLSESEALCHCHLLERPCSWAMTSLLIVNHVSITEGSDWSEFMSSSPLPSDQTLLLSTIMTMIYIKQGLFFHYCIKDFDWSLFARKRNSNACMFFSYLLKLNASLATYSEARLKCHHRDSQNWPCNRDDAISGKWPRALRDRNNRMWRYMRADTLLVRNYKRAWLYYLFRYRFFGQNTLPS